MTKFFGIVDVNGDMYIFSDCTRFISVAAVGGEEAAEARAKHICGLLNNSPVGGEYKPYSVVSL